MSAIKNISLFVPHVFPNFTQKYVAEAFADLGDVDRVDFVVKQDRDGKTFNAVYVHFNKWYDNRGASVIQNDIANNGSSKLYHDDSEYYWILLPNTAKKHLPGERKPRLDLGEFNSINVKAVENTPENKTREVVCLDAPKKPSYYYRSITPTLSDEECLELLRAPIEEWDVEASDEAAQMAEIEDELAAEDDNLVSIDWRYVQAIEQENCRLHGENFLLNGENCQLNGEIAQLRMALINLDQMYQAEKAKVRAFSNV
jgi:hypothetical protein